MTANCGTKSFLTLREASEALVPPELRERWETALEEKREFERRHKIGRRRTRGSFVFPGDPPPARNPAKSSKEYRELKANAADAEHKVMTMFYEGLADSMVEARKGSPTDSLTVIPPSALPSFEAGRGSRLRITSYDASTMAFGYKEKRIDYYDVRVSFPDNRDEPDNQQRTDCRKRIATPVLARFLEDLAASLEPGDRHLTEKALWEAARNHNSDNHVTRQQVRDWMNNQMDPAKRFRPGQKPNK